MELIGIPNIVTISKRTIENNHFEFRTREVEEGVHLSLNELLKEIKD